MSVTQVKTPATHEVPANADGIHSYLDALPEIDHVYDRDWRWVYINEAAADWLRSLGRNPAELIGRCVWDEFEGSRSEPSYEAATLAVREQREVLYERSVGGCFYETRIIPHSGGIVSLTRNVTERKQQERRARILVETSALFASALTQAKVMASLVERARGELGAIAAALAATAEDGSAIEIVYGVGTTFTLQLPFRPDADKSSLKP